MNTADKAVKFLVENGIWNQFNQDTGEATITKYFLIETLSKFAASQSPTLLQEEDIDFKELGLSAIVELEEIGAIPVGHNIPQAIELVKYGYKAALSKAARVDEQSKDLVVRDTLYEFAKFMNQWLSESEQFNDVGLKNIIRDYVASVQPKELKK